MFRTVLGCVVLTLLLPGTHTPAQEICIADSFIGKAMPDLGQAGQGVEVIVQLKGGGTEKLVLPKAAVLFNNTWERGQTLLVEFVDNRLDPVLIQRVEEHIRTWEKYVNLRIVLVPAGKTARNVVGRDAHIRITFQGNGHYSYIGTASVSNKALQEGHSMSLRLTRNSPDDEIRRVVLHEFGHALGFGHEHQSPRAGIRWKQPEATRYFMARYGWDAEKVKQNLFDPIRETEAQATAFDPNSIMLYAIPRGLTTDGFSAGWNNRLSAVDMNAAAATYPAEVDNVFGVRYRVAPGFLPPGILLGAVAANSPLCDLREVGGPLNIRGIAEGGDILRSINGNPVSTPADFRREVARVQGRFTIVLWDVRQEKDRVWTGSR